MSETWAVDAGTTTVVRLSEELSNYFRRRVDHTPDAEDLLSRTWLAAGRTFGGRCSLRTYLYSIAHRLIAAHFERRRRCCLGPAALADRSADADLEEQLAAQVTLAQVHSALRELPPHYADVVRLTLLGYGPHAIARELGINYNTARTRSTRGKAKLLALLADQESGADRSDKSEIR